ncbi:MAG: hypothetical protein AAFY84_02715 [Pseudomonadota bacterium]
MIPAALKESLFLVGAVTVIIGLLLRRLPGNFKGLGFAVILVGLVILIGAPLGRFLGWW